MPALRLTRTTSSKSPPFQTGPLACFSSRPNGILAIAKLKIRHGTIHHHQSQSQHYYATTTSTPFRSSAHNVSAVPPPPVEEPLSLHDQHLLRLDTVKRRVRPDWSAARWSREGFAHREWPSRPTLPSFLLERVKSTTATTTSSSAMTHDMNEPAIFQQNLQSAKFC